MEGEVLVAEVLMMFAVLFFFTMTAFLLLVAHMVAMN